MKNFIYLILLFAVGQASAQFSEVEADSTTLADVSDEDTPGKYKLLGRTFDLTLFSLSSVETDKGNEEGGRFSTFNYITFSSYVGFDYKFVFRIPFTYATAGTDRFNGSKNNKAEWAIQDLVLGLRNPELFYMPWDMAAYWEGRLYLPTSKHSQDSGLIARLSNKFIFSKVFSRYFEMDLTESQDYYHQSRTRYPATFTDEYGFEVKDVPSATRRFSFDHALTGWLKWDAKTGAGWRFTLSDDFYNKSDVPENRYREPSRRISMGPQVRFELSNYANFILGYEDSVDRLDNSKEFGKFLAKNTEFSLLSFIRF